MKKSEIIQNEINRVIEEIESAKNFIDLQAGLKQNLENIIKYLDDLRVVFPVNFTISGLKYCYQDQLNFVEKRISDREKLCEKRESQLRSLQEILDLVEKEGG